MRVEAIIASRAARIESKYIVAAVFATVATVVVALLRVEHRIAPSISYPKLLIYFAECRPDSCISLRRVDAKEPESETEDDDDEQSEVSWC
jgi:hypothetical protein